MNGIPEQWASGLTYMKTDVLNRVVYGSEIIFNEDGAHLRVDHAPENMAIIRHIAVNLLTSERTMKVGTQAKRLRAACSNQYLEKVIKSHIT